eukprot:m.86196 g.86196  ORF g.86196 m.86196 type:complete len:403 (+) comp9659_c1_seq1:191-1399(+)
MLMSTTTSSFGTGWECVVAGSAAAVGGAVAAWYGTTGSTGQVPTTPPGEARQRRSPVLGCTSALAGGVALGTAWVRKWRLQHACTVAHVPSIQAPDLLARCQAWGGDARLVHTYGSVARVIGMPNNVVFETLDQYETLFDGGTPHRPSNHNSRDRRTADVAYHEEEDGVPIRESRRQQRHRNRPRTVRERAKQFYDAHTSTRRVDRTTARAERIELDGGTPGWMGSVMGEARPTVHVDTHALDMDRVCDGLYTTQVLMDAEVKGAQDKAKLVSTHYVLYEDGLDKTQPDFNDRKIKIGEKTIATTMKADPTKLLHVFGKARVHPSGHVVVTPFDWDTGTVNFLSSKSKEQVVRELSACAEWHQTACVVSSCITALTVCACHAGLATHVLYVAGGKICALCYT